MHPYYIAFNTKVSLITAAVQCLAYFNSMIDQLCLKSVLQQ